MQRWMIESRVVGVTFDGRQAEAAKVKADDWLRVVPEPENEYDPNAAGVWRVNATGQPIGKVGFVPKDEAPLVGRSARDGYEVWAHVREVTGGTEDYPTRGLRITLRRRLSVAKERTG